MSENIRIVLIMKKCHTNFGINQMKDEAATAASGKHICHSLTIIIWILIGSYDKYF